MKINKKETYSVDEMSKEEFLFLLEVIEKLQLASNSTPEAHSVAKKFKELRQEMLGEPSSISCDGCETTLSVESLLCPVEQLNKPLCPTCFVQRKHIADRIGK